MFRRSRAVGAACAAVQLSVASLALTALGADDLAGLSQTLAGLAKRGPGEATIGIAVVDVLSGTEILVLGADQPLNPASNTKIVTAACALKTLGPEFRYETSLHGQKDGPVVRGPLYIKGHGDPTLRSEHLWAMARELSAAGIRRVEGGIVVDDTYFDSANLPFAFDQQPNEDAAFRTPLGAVSLDHNALAVTIGPGPSPLSPGLVTLSSPGYAVLVNDTITMSEGAANPKISATQLENRTRLRVYGQLPLGAQPVTYFRRIDNPSLFAGYGLKAAVESAGISVGGSVQVSTMPAGTAQLAGHVSEPLSSILWETGKVSNNFVTEMVLKTMGAREKNTPASWDAALTAASQVLAAWGLKPGSYTYRNASGLFDANRFSARQLAQVLRAAYLDAAIRPEFLSQLATGGVDGTIAGRYQDKAAKRMVRAKTGTLDDVSSLTGYVLDAQGTRPIAFAILVTNAPGRVSSARTYQEDLVTAIARYLNPRP